MSLFNRMAEAVIRDLSPEERMGLSETAFARIIRTCHDVAVSEGSATRFPPTEPTPPRMQFVRVDALKRGDQVWMPDCHYASIDVAEHAGENAHLSFADGTFATTRLTRNAKVAVRVEQARAWNAIWELMAVDTRAWVAERYGYRSVAV